MSFNIVNDTKKTQILVYRENQLIAINKNYLSLIIATESATTITAPKTTWILTNYRTNNTLPLAIEKGSVTIV